MQNLLSEILITIGIFLPAYFANMAPVLLVKTRLFKILGNPIDGGKMLWGERVFGKGKTFYGIVVALLGGAIGSLTSMIIVVALPCITNSQMCGEIYVQLVDSILNNALLLILATTIIILNGMIIGFGAILGDLVESFIKRRLKIRSGKSLPIFDQIDFIIGAWIAIILLYPETAWKYFLIALIITPLLHLLANIIAYKLKLKKVWW